MLGDGLLTKGGLCMKKKSLGNDPGKVDSNFFCYAATVLPHIGMFSFLHRECINLHEGRLRNKMHLHSTLTRAFICLL